MKTVARRFRNICIEMNVLLTMLLLSVTAAVAQHADKVCFYTIINYSGMQLCGMAGEQIDVFFSYYSLNDMFNSVRVPNGLQVLAFMDVSFYGVNMTYKEDTPNLGTFSNSISSFIVQSTESQYATRDSENNTTRHFGKSTTL